MPTLDDILRASGLSIIDDEQLGRFIGPTGQYDSWSLSGKVDFPFQKDVPLTVELTQKRKRLPRSMPKNVHWLLENLGEIWNAAAPVINTTIESEQIWTPPHFSLGHFWAFIPDAPLNAAEWRVEIEPADMIVSFEVVFRGLAIIRHAALGN
jgi:hypothetical protein